MKYLAVYHRLPGVLFLIGLFSVVIFAQNSRASGFDKSRIEGTWVLDWQKSNFGRFGPFPGYKDYKEIISVDDDRLTIRYIYAFNGTHSDDENVLFGDGRGETNRELKSRTVWKKDGLIRKFSQKTTFGWVGYTQQYQLSVDANTLICKMDQKATMQGFNDNSSLVFHRKP